MFHKLSTYSYSAAVEQSDSGRMSANRLGVILFSITCRKHMDSDLLWSFQSNCLLRITCGYLHSRIGTHFSPNNLGGTRCRAIHNFRALPLRVGSASTVCSSSELMAPTAKNSSKSPCSGIILFKKSPHIAFRKVLWSL